MPRAYYNEIDPYAAQWLRNLIAEGAIAPGDVDERSIVEVAPADLKGYTQCHFFAGIGVWSYALRQAGWPDERQVFSGSCPCQPFSSAGKRKGFDDDRHLWPAFFDLIQKCRPATVFGEQVSSADGLAWFDHVQTDLEGAGYAVGALDLCAAGIGAPHIRQRLFFVGQRDGDSVGMAHGIGAGLEGHAGDGHDGDQSRWFDAEPPRSVAAGGSIGGLADADGRDTGTEGVQRGGEHGQQPQDGGAGWLAESDGRGRAARREATEAARHGHSAVPASGPDRHEQPGPTNGFWGVADWLFCRDGKWRPTQPGLFPLVDGLASDMGSLRPGENSPYRTIQDENGKPIGQAPWRTGMLRGYGNAIVAPVAIEFIRAYLGTCADRAEGSPPTDTEQP